MYAAGIKKYISFYSQAKLRAVPASEDTLVLLITYLAQQKLSYATILAYLAAVCYSHVTSHEYSISTTRSTPQMTQVLKGIHRSQSFLHTAGLPVACLSLIHI